MIFFCIFYEVNILFLHQSYLKSPLPVKSKRSQVLWLKFAGVLLLRAAQDQVGGAELLLDRGHHRRPAWDQRPQEQVEKDV